MKPLLILGASLAALFASTFLILAAFGGFGAEEARELFERVSRLDGQWVAVLLVILLFADLFVAMPTLTLCILAGYYLGPWGGGIFSSIGMIVSGVCGYGISRRYGAGLLRRICRDEKRLSEAKALFSERGRVVLLLCRASPILPEVSSCLAGAVGMRFGVYLLFFVLASVPYAFVAARAGAASSLDNPAPALYTAVGITLFLWIVWWIVSRRSSAK